METCLLALTGAGTGIIGALLGIGGGAFIIPALVIFFHVPMHFAIAASLLSVVATSSAATSFFLPRGLANMRLGMTLEMFTTVGGILGALVAVVMSEKALQLLFAGVLVITAIAMWKRPKEYPRLLSGERGSLGARYYDGTLEHEVSYRIERLPLGFFVSLMAGALSGLLGIGGGVAKVPVMVLGMKVPLRAATATSDLMIGVTAVAGLYVYYAHHRVDLLVAAPAAAGTLVGSLFGANFVTRVNSHATSVLFTVFLLLTSTEMILRATGTFQ